MENNENVNNNEIKVKRKNTFGLIGFIFSIVSILSLGALAFPGLILSIIGLIESKKCDNDKKDLSITGIFISSVMLIIFGFIMLNSDSTESSSNSDDYNDNIPIVKVIDFTNMDKQSADSWCDENRITCFYNEEYSDTVENGKIISQDKKAGKEIKQASIINLKISKGREKTPEEIKNEYIASRSDYNYKDIARNPDNYKGAQAKFTGQVKQVSEGYLNNVTLRVGVSCTKYQYIEGYDCPDIIYVTYTYSDGESRILEDDMITMYGSIKGLKSYTSILGAKITIPELEAKYIMVN